MAATPLIALNLACSAALVGLIWTVGVAVYPLYAHIGPERFGAYHRGWTAAITYVVGPLMLAELVAAGLLCREAPRLGVALLVPVVVAWAVTAFWAVPMHGRLETGFVDADWRSLCLANHVRAAAWTLRAGVLLAVALRG